MRPLSRWTRTAAAAMVAAATLARPQHVSAQQVRIDVNADVVAAILHELPRVVHTAVDPRTTRILGDALDEASKDVLAALHAAIAVHPRQRGDFRIEQTDRIQRTLSIGPTGSLELTNVSGDITVTAGSGRDVVVEIVRRARARTDADARLGLQEVQVTVEQRAERGSVAVVHPANVGRRPYLVNVVYNVTAPAGTRLTTASVSGNITLKGIKGDVDANVIGGNIDIVGASRVSNAHSVSGNVTITDTDSEGTVTAGSLNGNVMLDRVKARLISADVVSGNIIVRDATCDSAQLKALSGTIEYSGRVARGGHYELNAFSGSVRFLTSGPAGFAIQASTFSGSIRPDPGVTMKSLSTSSRQLRGTVGDGSAVVALTTFSGNITIGVR